MKFAFESDTENPGFIHDGRWFLEPHAVEAYHDTASLCEDPRRGRERAAVTIVFPSRSDTGCRALLTWSTVDACPDLLVGLCKAAITAGMKEAA